MITTPLERIRLLMFGYLYAGKHQKAKRVARKYIKSLEKAKHFSKELLDTMKAEGEIIISLIEKQQFQTISERLNKNIAENLEMLKLSGTADDRYWKYNK